MLESLFAALRPAGDPYEGVALGVECAWPSAATFAKLADEGWGDALWNQYTVSTGTPNR
jgi:hypothetical protein